METIISAVYSASSFLGQGVIISIFCICNIIICIIYLCSYGMYNSSNIYNKNAIYADVLEIRCTPNLNYTTNLNKTPGLQKSSVNNTSANKKNNCSLDLSYIVNNVVLKKTLIINTNEDAAFFKNNQKKILINYSNKDPYNIILNSEMSDSSLMYICCLCGIFLCIITYVVSYYSFTNKNVTAGVGAVSTVGMLYEVGDNYMGGGLKNIATLSYT